MTAKMEIDQIAEKIVSMRKKPLLVLYWHICEDCEIDDKDHTEVYKELRKNLNERIPEIDVIIHTLGGNSHESYQIARSIREFADYVTFMIPEEASSGGTVIALSGNKILFAHCARLSPIDVQHFVNDYKSKDILENDSTVYLSKYVDFVKETMDDLDKDIIVPTGIEKVMIEQLVKEIGVVQIARVHRQKSIAIVYANNLLKYPFPLDEATRANIIDSLVNSAPSHSTVVDYEMAKVLSLPVEKMSLELSDITKELIEKLSEASESFEICELMKDGTTRNLFTKYYPKKIEPSS
jgi:membrane-bound ClpP family serine protease